MEKSTPVETEIFNYYCNTPGCLSVVECMDGGMLMSHPPQFRHQCVNCKREYYLPVKYPYPSYTIKNTIETTKEEPTSIIDHILKPRIMSDMAISINIDKFLESEKFCRMDSGRDTGYMRQFTSPSGKYLINITVVNEKIKAIVSLSSNDRTVDVFEYWYEWSNLTQLTERMITTAHRLKRFE